MFGFEYLLDALFTVCYVQGFSHELGRLDPSTPRFARLGRVRIETPEPGLYIRKLPCSDVRPRENDKAAAWSPCISVHLRILWHVFYAHPCIVEFGQVRANPCKGGSVQVRAMGALCLPWGALC